MTVVQATLKAVLRGSLVAVLLGGCGGHGEPEPSAAQPKGGAVVHRAIWGGEFLRLPGDQEGAGRIRGLMATEVTVAMWRWFEPTVERRRAPFGRDDAPITEVSYARATEFARWASSQASGWTYSLPTVEQWKQALGAGWSDAGVVTLASDEITKFGNVGDRTAADELEWPPGVGAAGRDGFAWVAPVASFRPNLAGFHDLLGNVWEWTSDVATVGTSPAHIVVGGGWHIVPVPAAPGVTAALEDATSTGTCGLRLLATRAGP